MRIFGYFLFMLTSIFNEIVFLGRLIILLEELYLINIKVPIIKE